MEYLFKAFTPPLIVVAMEKEKSRLQRFQESIKTP
jgi:hypothetical protein